MPIVGTLPEEAEGPGREAHALWNRVLDATSQADRLAFLVAAWGQAVSYENGTLTVAFPPDSDAKIKSFTTAIEKYKDAINSISPGIAIRVITGAPVPPMTEDEVERLRRTFDGKLIVED